MGNIAFISSKKNLTTESVYADLCEINDRRFGGYFTIRRDDKWSLWSISEENTSYPLWEFHTYSKRKIGGKHPRPGWYWIMWSWTVFRMELAHAWGGRLSDEGVEGTWEPDLQKYATLDRYIANLFSDPIHHMSAIQSRAREQVPKELLPYAYEVNHEQ